VTASGLLLEHVMASMPGGRGNGFRVAVVGGLALGSPVAFAFAMPRGSLLAPWQAQGWPLEARAAHTLPLRCVARSAGGGGSAARDSSRDGADTDWHDLRFRGVGVLFGRAALSRLRGARAAVLGIGGVGSWVVEGLARTGLGGLTLVDLDDICISNTNRQLHTLSHTVGRPKVDVMAERVGYINPECDVDTVHDFFAEETADLILDRHAYDVVIDAIDSVSEKARLIAGCHRRGIPIVVSGGLGGRSDPTMFREVDMARAEGDGLLRRVRSELRKKYGFPAGNVRPPHRKWGVPGANSLRSSLRGGRGRAASEANV